MTGLLSPRQAIPENLQRLPQRPDQTQRRNRRHQQPRLQTLQRAAAAILMNKEG